MAKHLVDVEINAFEYDANKNRTIVKRTVQVEVDDDFQIDGISMPTPSYAFVSVNPMTKDAKRLPGNGEMVAPYFGTAFNVTWEYKLLNAAQYKLIYDAYVKSTIEKKDMFHKIKTIDMNTGEHRELTIYTESSFGVKPYMMKDGISYFRDITLSMVDKAGEV
jgi:hypothetical protein